jgi:hypothetical protein
MLPVQWWKLLNEPVVLQGYMGSFDCVAVRFANGDSAQEDRVTG